MCKALWRKALMFYPGANNSLLSVQDNLLNFWSIEFIFAVHF
jgi:hypothetical protein